MYRISESSHYGLYRLTSSSVSSSFLILTQYSGNSIDFIYWSIDLKLTKRPISNTNHTKFPSNSTRGRTSNQNLKPAAWFLNHWEWRVNLIRASQTILLHWTLQPILLVFSHRNLYLIQGQAWQRRCATVFFFVTVVVGQDSYPEGTSRMQNHTGCLVTTPEPPHPG